MGEKNIEVKYLVYIHWVMHRIPPTYCILKDTYEEAEAWIAEVIKAGNTSEFRDYRITQVIYEPSIQTISRRLNHGR